MPLGLGPFLDQIVTLLLLIAAAIGGIHLYKKNVNPSPPAQTQAAYNAEPTATSSSAEEILRERYARGEIDRPRYLEMLRNLKAHSSGVSSKRVGNLSAEEIVRERYARGEMDRAQFGQMLNDLRSDLSSNL
jgi:uncharacterized membrane protein